MNKFPLSLLIEDIGTVNSTQVFRLIEDFKFISDQFGVIICPKGFESNGASIPRCFWSIMSPVGPYFKSSIFHDFGYSKDYPYNFTRKQVDDMFLEAMKFQNVGFVTRSLIYSSVKTFGWMFYKKT